MCHSRGRSPAAQRTWRPTTILVPTDFSYAADHALRHAVRLGRRLRAGLALLHVAAPVPDPERLFTPIRTDQPELLDLSQQRLARLARRMAVRPKQMVVRAGPAAREILKFADEIQAGLIVIGAHGHNALERLLMGGTTGRIVRHAHCPVLVVPPPEVKSKPNRINKRKSVS